MTCHIAMNHNRKATVLLALLCFQPSTPACPTPVLMEGRATRSRLALSVTVQLAGLGPPVLKVRVQTGLYCSALCHLDSQIQISISCYKPFSEMACSKTASNVAELRVTLVLLQAIVIVQVQSHLHCVALCHLNSQMQISDGSSDVVVLL